MPRAALDRAGHALPGRTTHEVNAYVARAVAASCARGATASWSLAPSHSPELVRESRRLIRAGARKPERAVRPRRRRARARRRRAAAVRRRRGGPRPSGRRRAHDRGAAGDAPLDFVHVHEPWAPSAASVALRHSRALNVATFHRPTERVLSTQVARRFVETFFGRIDARPASFQATRELMDRFFPGHYQVVARAPRRAARSPPTTGRCTSSSPPREERAALRLFLRALRRLPDDLDWGADGARARRGPVPARARALRDRVALVDGTTRRRAGGRRRRRRRVDRAGARARAARARARRGRGAGRLAAARLRGGGRRRRGRPAVRARRRRRRSPPSSSGSSATPALRDAAARRRARRARELAWTRVADDVEAVYERLAAPPRPGRGDPTVRARLAGASDRRRPAHAHRPLARLRDAGRGAARRPRATVAWARSRSPTTTRSPARSRPRGRPRTTASR